MGRFWEVDLIARRTNRRLAVRQAAFVCIVGLAVQSLALAHEGPPFPILMDEPVAGFLVSVWADPDIGDAEFFIVLESPQGGMPAAAPHVEMWVQPVDGRLNRVTWQASRKPLRGQMQFEATPFFDRRDKWDVGIRITPLDGPPDEVMVQVESTPPGYGAWDLLIYLFPFLFIAAFWGIAMLRRHRVFRSH